MSNIDIKHGLKEYWYITQHLCNMADRYNKLRAQAERITPVYSPVPGGGSNQDKLAKQVSALVDMEIKYQAEFAAARNAMHKVEQLIASLDDYTQRIVLEDRYLSFMKWEEIAVKRGYTYRWVLKLHGKALEALKKR